MRIASLGELAGALAHELNQPLAAILTNAQAARRFLDQGSMSGGELRTILDDIIRDDKRAGGVIHNLRRMASKHPADREDCCMNDVVREVIDLMKGELLGEHIEARCFLAPVLQCVEGVRVELQQVLVNLLVNAVQAMKATPAGQRSIEVVTASEASRVLVVVSDHGSGIPVNRLANVFRPFVTTKDEGLGIGLSICRRIIESHGGRIEVTNRVDGIGARFIISLPAK
jgi:C4-dicarboxylate-specific signal transduction histidine kinase